VNSLQELLSDFLSFVKINTRSDEKSNTIPTTPGQKELALLLKRKLEDLGLSQVQFLDDCAFTIGCLKGNVANKAIGFIAHVDTADYNAENIQPQVFENYDGSDLLLNAEHQIYLRVADSPNLKDYIGETLITTDGLTLLGADDKAGIAEIFAMLRFYVAHPEVSRPDIWVAFGPDEEIGRGADRFPVDKFPVDFAYTIDSGRVGHFEYETFNAAKLDLEIKGISVHPGTAYQQMVNALKLALEIDAALPQEAVPEKTRGYEGFYLLHDLNGTIAHATANYIIRDHDQQAFADKKAYLVEVIEKINARYSYDPISYQLTDQYYNMRPIVEKCPASIDLAIEAMKNLAIEPIIEPFRGGTDGSKISYLGIPTPNIFTGGENFHGQYEFISLQAMEKAAQTLIEIVRLYGKK
jgi:tripeptide aminopeptidase